jgi:hypothetical protein
MVLLVYSIYGILSFITVSFGSLISFDEPNHLFDQFPTVLWKTVTFAYYFLKISPSPTLKKKKKVSDVANA